MNGGSPPLASRAVLFDLDGTLADTAPDLGYVLNLQLRAHGCAELPVDALRPYVSHGARGMLRAGFGLEAGDAGYPALRDEFLDLYERNLFRETRLFPGMAELLDGLERRAIAWGVVTNKLERFTAPLIQALGLADRAGCVISGDTTPRAKPHPDPLFEASRRLGVKPSECSYVGDDERDVQASHAAGMTPVVALYGYLGNGKPPHEWGAGAYIEHPLQLLNLL
ncbi:MAG TPA: HAD-IA family hydrolase [Burkholderiales bacterium]|nr:HAD-IA family hydrolase [Burkholderiales bacterium]